MQHREGKHWMGHRLFRTGNVCYRFEEQIVILYSWKSLNVPLLTLIVDNNLFTYVCLFYDIVNSLEVERGMIYLHLLVFSHV